ncbi:MAG: ABC transporter ATP-binding protein [Lachnospiraceae bacterium]|jgi:ABC-2 type transport system ATP-binding protein|nr:ABC transporter ATP-binding protein [Lachnospiraceae bacterium]
MGTVIYQAIDITAGYGRKVVFGNLSLDLIKGSCTFIIGANGCGKSTLFSVLAGIKKMRSGQLLLDGEKAAVRQLQKQIGYVPQDNPLFSELTVWDNLLLWYGGKKAVQKEMDGGVIEKLGLRDILKKRVGTLSGGMQRRACIGCAMAGNPRILIMDEPGAALDLECKEILYSYLDEYRKAEGTVLMSSHEKAEWEMGDRIFLLKDGILQDFRSS